MAARRPFAILALPPPRSRGGRDRARPGARHGAAAAGEAWSSAARRQPPAGGAAHGALAEPVPRRPRSATFRILPLGASAPLLAASSSARPPRVRLPGRRRSRAADGPRAADGGRAGGARSVNLGRAGDATGPSRSAGARAGVAAGTYRSRVTRGRPRRGRSSALRARRGKRRAQVPRRPRPAPAPPRARRRPRADTGSGVFPVAAARTRSAADAASARAQRPHPPGPGHHRGRGHPARRARAPATSSGRASRRPARATTSSSSTPSTTRDYVFMHLRRGSEPSRRAPVQSRRPALGPVGTTGDADRPAPALRALAGRLVRQAATPIDPLPQLQAWAAAAEPQAAGDAALPSAPLGEIAQLVEHTTENRGVPGSSPGLAIAAPGF